MDILQLSGCLQATANQFVRSKFKFYSRLHALHEDSVVFFAGPEEEGPNPIERKRLRGDK
jgi:hypothetical protein